MALSNPGFQESSRHRRPGACHSSPTCSLLAHQAPEAPLGKAGLHEPRLPIAARPTAHTRLLCWSWPSSDPTSARTSHPQVLPNWAFFSSGLSPSSLLGLGLLCVPSAEHTLPIAPFFQGLLRVKCLNQAPWPLSPPSAALTTLNCNYSSQLSRGHDLFITTSLEHRAGLAQDRYQGMQQ